MKMYSYMKNDLAERVLNRCRATEKEAPYHKPVLCRLHARCRRRWSATLAQHASNRRLPNAVVKSGAHLAGTAATRRSCHHAVCQMRRPAPTRQYNTRNKLQAHPAMKDGSILFQETLEHDLEAWIFWQLLLITRKQ